MYRKGLVFIRSIPTLAINMLDPQHGVCGSEWRTPFHRVMRLLVLATHAKTFVTLPGWSYPEAYGLKLLAASSRP